jgi:CO dehydrogenase maturation factor
MLIVVEPGMRSVDTAITIARMAKEIGVGNVLAVLNKCSSENEEALVAKELKKQQMGLIATLPNSNLIRGADLLGVSPMDMPGIEPLLPIFQLIKDRIDLI